MSFFSISFPRFNEALNIMSSDNGMSRKAVDETDFQKCRKISDFYTAEAELELLSWAEIETLVTGELSEQEALQPRAVIATYLLELCFDGDLENLFFTG